MLRLSSILRRTITAAFVLAAALCPLQTSRAHSFQTNLYPDIELTEKGLIIELWVATFLFPPLAHVEFGDGEPRPTTEEMREKLVTFFGETCPITMDGEIVPPQLDWLKFEEVAQGEHLGEQLDFTFAKMRFVHPCDTVPRTLNFHWGIWFPDGVIEVAEEGEIVSHDPNVLDTLIFTPHGEEAIYLTKAEPEVLWHAPKREFADTSAAIDAVPASAPPRMLTVPFAPIMIWVAFGLTALITRPLKLPRKAIRIGFVASLVASILARSALPVEFPHPAGGSALPELTEAKAKDKFLELHRGIYRAFEAESEDAIYNKLAQSVDGPLLDRLYEEVYHSLIMRSEGNGAVSRVSSIDYLETISKPAEDGLGFEIDCTWRVNGIVRHWGHAHRRTNEYQADYLLAPRGARWTIAAATVNLQKRVKTAEDRTGEPDSDPYPRP